MNLTAWHIAILAALIAFAVLAVLIVAGSAVGDRSRQLDRDIDRILGDPREEPGHPDHWQWVVDTHRPDFTGRVCVWDGEAWPCETVALHINPDAPAPKPRRWNRNDTGEAR